MIAEQLWKARKAKKVVVHQLRARRACFGELIQMDGSPHTRTYARCKCDWFEGRAESCLAIDLYIPGKYQRPPSCGRYFFQ